MAKITNYQNTLGEPMVMVENDDGTIWSGTKAAYDAQQTALAATPPVAAPATPEATPQA